MIKCMNKRAFTLVELLVTISIIGILSTFIVVNYTGAKVKSRDARRIADLDSISSALGVYNAQNKKYASDYGTLDSSKGLGNLTDSPTGNNWDAASGLMSLVPDFISKLPVDPLNDANHFYYYEPVSAGQVQFGVTCGSSACAYILSAKLEKQSQQSNPGCNACYPNHDYCVSGGGAKLNSPSC